jgi:hypothetical protein
MAELKIKNGTNRDVRMTLPSRKKNNTAQSTGKATTQDNTTNIWGLEDYTWTHENLDYQQYTSDMQSKIQYVEITEFQPTEVNNLMKIVRDATSNIAEKVNNASGNTLGVLRIEGSINTFVRKSQSDQKAILKEYNELFTKLYDPKFVARYYMPYYSDKVINVDNKSQWSVENTKGLSDIPLIGAKLSKITGGGTKSSDISSLMNAPIRQTYSSDFIKPTTFIPDAYELKMVFKSMVPQNFNTQMDTLYDTPQGIDVYGESGIDPVPKGGPADNLVQTISDKVDKAKGIISKAIE